MHTTTLELQNLACELSPDEVATVSGGLRKLSPDEEVTYAMVVGGVTGGSIAAGAALGAVIGAAGGPIGAGVGALIGAIFSAVVYLAQP